jgi:hypothetical protein
MNFKQWLLHEEIEGARTIYKDLLDFLRNSSEDLYVHFSQQPRFEMIPTKKPSHYDPIGIYAFPKDYVLKETSRNDGFFSMPYITVFKLKEDAKILNLSSITEEEAMKLLKKMGIEDYIEKAYSRSRGPTGGHLLWNTMEKYIALNEFGKNTTWNKLFKKAGGFDVAKDEGSSVIHHNEPEQILVLNKSVIEVIKNIENPYKSYVGSFYTNIINVAKEIGSKYFGDYYIQSLERKGAKKPDNFYTTRQFEIVSNNRKLPYSISFYYSGENLSVKLKTHHGSHKLAEIEYETKNAGLLHILKKDFDKNEILEEVEKNINKYLNSFDENIGKEAEDLLIAINKRLKVPNPQNVEYTNNEAYKEFPYYAGYPLMFKIIVDSNFKDKTNVIFQWHESKSLSSYRRNSSYKFTFDTTPQNVNPIEAINQFKTRISTLYADISKSDDWSRTYSYDKTVLKSLLENFFL